MWFGPNVPRSEIMLFHIFILQTQKLLTMLLCVVSEGTFQYFNRIMENEKTPPKNGVMDGVYFAV